jgi:transcriptional regulator with XRE-family HTH domain
MSHRNRTHTGGDSFAESMKPEHLTKQEFGRRIYKLMLEKGWNQSELARRADLPRHSISVYINARSLPTPQSLEKLARALGTTADELLPNHVEAAIEADIPSLELSVSSDDPTKAWLRMNRLVSTRTAGKIVELLATEDTAELEAEAERSEKMQTLFDLLGQSGPEADFDFDPPRLGELSSSS